MAQNETVTLELYKRALLRERRSRERAEEILENRSRELYLANCSLQENQAQLVHSEKMAGLGQIAAGVAHEINNPIGFVLSNLGALTKYAGVFKRLLIEYEKLAMAVRTGKDSEEKEVQEILTRIAEIQQKGNLAYILEDIGHLLAETSDGTSRVKEIVQNLKSFARLDESELKEANINDGIDATIKIIWNELKYKCQVNKKFGQIPSIHCYPGQLNQVFMNILLNAAQAIPDRGEISIETEATDTHIVIRISDTGQGIPPENISKLFNPFFTTKPAGKGTGLGLSITYGIIKKHNGTIDVKSKEGKGTTFTIRLPIKID